MSGVLVDTSVWVDHFRHPNEVLKDLLDRDLVLTHPLVIGEIACGTPPAPRSETIDALGQLATAQHASLNETMAFIERESIYGKGCGLIDLVLLASTLMTPGAVFWTLDKRLADVAHRFAVLYLAAPH